MSHDISEVCEHCAEELKSRQIGPCEDSQRSRKATAKTVEMTKARIPLYHLGVGCALVVVAEFPFTPEGTKAANDYMAANNGVGVLDASGQRIVLASNSDKGIPVSGPVRTLQCNCCGSTTTGRQWHNRDTGYGLCDKCIDFCARHETPESFQRTYGLRGIHYALEDTLPMAAGWAQSL